MLLHFDTTMNQAVGAVHQAFIADAGKKSRELVSRCCEADLQSADTELAR